ncbi:DUF4283 domain protein, partial [Trifolium medium]|nr:DUF4283 domain protein [Trifolium medium]
MATICPRMFMVATTPAYPTPTIPQSRLFSQVLHDACDIQISQLPLPAIKGDALCIKIAKEEYKKGLEDCKRNLHGRLILNKGDKSITTKGCEFYEFQFENYEDMCKAWSMDEFVKNITFRQYARIMMDMDLSRCVFDEIMVERDG